MAGEMVTAHVVILCAGIFNYTGCIYAYRRKYETRYDHCEIH